MSKGWTEERRRAQAERIRKNKPWEKSTGPRTEKGKARSRLNALKHGQRSETMKEMGRKLSVMEQMNKGFIKAFVELKMAQDENYRLTKELIEKREKSEY